MVEIEGVELPRGSSRKVEIISLKQATVLKVGYKAFSKFIASLRGNESVEIKVNYTGRCYDRINFFAKDSPDVVLCDQGVSSSSPITVLFQDRVGYIATIKFPQNLDEKTRVTIETQFDRKTAEEKGLHLEPSSQS